MNHKKLEEFIKKKLELVDLREVLRCIICKK